MPDRRDEAKKRAQDQIGNFARRGMDHEARRKGQPTSGQAASSGCRFTCIAFITAIGLTAMTGRYLHLR